MSLSARFCPACVRRMDRVRRCRRCGYEAPLGVPTVAELMRGERASGATWANVDLHGYVAAVVAALGRAGGWTGGDDDLGT